MDSLYELGSSPCAKALLTARASPASIDGLRAWRTSLGISVGPGAFPFGRFLSSVWISSSVTSFVMLSVLLAEEFSATSLRSASGGAKKNLLARI